MTSMLDGCTPWPEEFVDYYWASGHWRGNTLDNLLRGWALQYGPRTALLHGDTRLTYAALNRRASRMAAGFRLRGLRPGQRVVVQLPDVPELVVSVFALMRAGVVPVLCPISYRAPEVSHVVQVSEATGYIGPPTYRGYDHTAMAAGIAARGPFLRRVFTFEAPGASDPYGGFTTDPSGCHYFPLHSLDSPPEPALALSAGQVALLLPSGGPGEVPGLVPRTHNDYAYQARAAAELVSLGQEDVYLSALPADLNLAFGGPGIIGTLTVGGTVVMVEDQDPGACLAAVERERVTVAALTPAAARLWLDARAGVGVGAESGVGADVSSLRLVQIGGSTPPLDRATAERVGAEWECGLQQAFAAAEGLLSLTRPGDPDETALTTQGRPLSPDDQIRIVGADGEELPAGEPGELLARGPYTVRGYYRASGLDARSFTADGYLRTGVLARRTQDGNLVVTGRVEGAAWLLGRQA
ncbi:AMP-binding protein [Streptomyces sp. NPDC051563]|uniref:AMP-binding protein n=1 Tax=Streptomyces sp. NPDC051563 TaxID=3365659 RepID=UPI00379AC2C4